LKYNPYSYISFAGLLIVVSAGRSMRSGLTARQWGMRICAAFAGTAIILTGIWLNFKY
jgi:hypothetical protein